LGTFGQIGHSTRLRFTILATILKYTVRHKIQPTAVAYRSVKRILKSCKTIANRHFRFFQSVANESSTFYAHILTFNLLIYLAVSKSQCRQTTEQKVILLVTNAHTYSRGARTRLFVDSSNSTQVT
jgi:hypothetical protein